MASDNTSDDIETIREAWQKHLDQSAGALEPDTVAYPKTILDPAVREARRIIAEAGLFDAGFYLAAYPDILAAQFDPLQHFIRTGVNEGRAPNRWFSPAYYISQGGMVLPGNALVHYIEAGEKAGIKPHPEFDPALYRKSVPAIDMTGVSPLWHFLTFGFGAFSSMPDRTGIDANDPEYVAAAWQSHLDDNASRSRPDLLAYPMTVLRDNVVAAREAIARSGLFDAKLYLTTYPDILNARVDPLQHFALSGAIEQRNPNAWFSTAFYRTQVEELPDNTNPLVHYIEVGERAGLKPHPDFDPARYRRLTPVVDQTGVSPLWHFLTFGTEDLRRKMTARYYAPRPRIEPKKPSLRQWKRVDELGVNFISPASRIAGLGVSARGFLDALEHGSIPVHPIEWTRGFEHHAACEVRHTGVKALQPINLVHMNADIFHLVANGLRQNGILSPDRYNIGIWYWELASFRPEWMPWIACLDEIWCASQFNVGAISAVSARPVKLMRPALAATKPTGQHKRAHFGLADDSTVFFYNCDLSSRIDRKNPEALIAAFRQEFGEDPGYQLVLKIGAPTYSAASTELVMKAVGDAANIRLIDRTLSDAELADLLAITFAYVSPHRSEGLGLTIIEAMLAGCPVIATGYGGSADFVFDDVARPLSYGLVELARTDEPYRRGCVWADPHMADLQRAMRELVAAPEAARAMGLRGKAHAEKLFAPQATAAAVQHRLREIWAAGSPPRA